MQDFERRLAFWLIGFAMCSLCLLLAADGLARWRRRSRTAGLRKSIHRSPSAEKAEN
jgi:hypothetical protein